MHPPNRKMEKTERGFSTSTCIIGTFDNSFFFRTQFYSQVSLLFFLFAASVRNSPSHWQVMAENSFSFCNLNFLPYFRTKFSCLLVFWLLWYIQPFAAVGTLVGLHILRLTFHYLLNLSTDLSYLSSKDDPDCPFDWTINTKSIYL